MTGPPTLRVMFVVSRFSEVSPLDRISRDLSNPCLLTLCRSLMSVLRNRSAWRLITRFRRLIRMSVCLATRYPASKAPVTRRILTPLKGPPRTSMWLRVRKCLSSLLYEQLEQVA